MEEKAKFNQYGVCIDCQGGFEGCKHNNLVIDGSKTLCALCGEEQHG